MRFQKFEFKRADGLVYRFLLRSGAGREGVYARSDEKVCVSFRREEGWVAWDAVTGMANGWPRIPFADQADHPPPGDWVSQKDERSYDYVLAYIS